MRSGARSSWPSVRAEPSRAAERIRSVIGARASARLGWRRAARPRGHRGVSTPRVCEEPVDRRDSAALARRRVPLLPARSRVARVVEAEQRRMVVVSLGRSAPASVRRRLPAVEAVGRRSAVAGRASRRCSPGSRRASPGQGGARTRRLVDVDQAMASPPDPREPGPRDRDRSRPDRRRDARSPPVEPPRGRPRVQAARPREVLPPVVQHVDERVPDLARRP